MTTWTSWCILIGGVIGLVSVQICIEYLVYKYTYLKFPEGLRKLISFTIGFLWGVFVLIYFI